MPHNSKHDDIMALTTQIVSAFLTKGTLQTSEVPAFIQQVYKTLDSLGADHVALADRPQPAVPIKKSVMPDYIVCLEDGKQLKMLKRHLKTAYNMSPEDYRMRWGLPPDYPMVAPSYAEKRSRLAKNIGLGTRKKR